jgi:hypothetical protein
MKRIKPLTLTFWALVLLFALPAISMDTDYGRLVATFIIAVAVIVYFKYLEPWENKENIRKLTERREIDIRKKEARIPMITDRERNNFIDQLKDDISLSMNGEIEYKLLDNRGLLIRFLNGETSISYRILEDSTEGKPDIVEVEKACINSITNYIEDNSKEFKYAGFDFIGIFYKKTLLESVKLV